MKKEKRKKVFIISVFIVMLVISFYVGKQNGVRATENTSSTITSVSEITVGTQTIQKTLTGSGQISSAETEKLTLNTNKYFKTMCVEDDDTVKKGDNLLQYSNGTYLTAEYDCVIISHSVPETGNICTSSNYIEVQSLETLNMTLNIEESQIADVKVNQEATVILTADETKNYTGKITKIDSIGTYATSGTTFTAIVEFENDGNVKIGMSASCTVVLEEVENVVAVPIAAVQTSDTEKYVVVVKEDGTTQNVTVETGISNDNYVQIISGLSGGENIQVVQTTTTSTRKNSSNSSIGSQRMNGGMQGMTGTESGRDFMTQGGQMGTPPGGNN